MKLPCLSVAGLQLRHNLPFLINMDIFSVHGRICVTVLPSYVIANPRDVIGAVDHSWSMTTPGRANNAQRVLAAVVNRIQVDGMSTSTAINTVLYGFGDTASFTTSSTYVPLRQGTALVAAADALRFAQQYHSMRTSASASTTVPQVHWSCSVCTKVNNRLVAVCYHCLTPYIVVDETASSSELQWSCLSCTFLNSSTNTSCEMCESAKPATKTTTTSNSKSCGAAEKLPGVVVLTDCESLKDHASAIAKIPPGFFDGRVWLMFGSGPSANIHDLMSLVPVRNAEQGYYIAVSDNPRDETPSLAIRDVLNSVAITFQGRTVYVKPGMSYLVPAGVSADELYVNGVVVHDAPPRPATLDVLHVLGQAMADSVTRRYNGVLSMLKTVDARNATFVEHLEIVRRFIRDEMAFLDDVIGITDIMQRAEHVASAGAGAGVGVAETETVRQRRRDTIRRGIEGTQILTDALRDIKRVVDGPVDAAAYAAATRLFNATSRGNMSQAALARLGARAVGRVSLSAYADMQKLLTCMTPDRGTFPNADAIDDAARLLSDAPFLDVITGDEEGCLVAVGELKRRPLVGVMNPCSAMAETVDTSPYDICAVHVMNTRFRSAVGDVNGVVGVFPGNSQAAAIAFGVIASVVGTGDWNTPARNQLGLLSLLIGVETALKAKRMTIAATLALGWAGVAARVKTRLLRANGEVDSESTLLDGLTAASMLLIAASSEPCSYMGPQLMRPGLWLALDYAMAQAQHVLGTTPMWDRAALQHAAVVQDIVAAASWAFQPLASKDNVARYAEEVKVLSAVRRGIYSRIGRYATEAMLCSSGLDLDGVKAAVRPVALRPALTAFLTFNPPYTYCNDVVNANVEGVLEAAFLDACLQSVVHDGVTRREARAALWTAVATDSDRVTTEIMTAFASPTDWEAGLASKALAHKDAMLKPIVDDLMRLCTLAYNNAVDDMLPLTFFDTPLSGSVTLKNGGTDDVFESPIAKGRVLGVCSGRHTGMPEKICMAMDSVHFLQFNSVGKYLSSTYAQGVTSYAPGLKLFHATLMGWCSNNESVKTPEDVLTLMRLTKTWSDVPTATKEKYVRQWFLQKHVYETVKTWSTSHVDTPLTIDAVCNVLGIACTLTRAAKWTERDAVLRAQVYGSVPEWSYEVAVVAFYVLRVLDTDAKGVWNTTPFLAALATHRAFVLPRHVFDASLTTHGCVKPLCLSTEAFDDIVDRVYTNLSIINRH